MSNQEVAQQLAPIVRRVLQDYLLPLDGFHGVSHWARVLENGLRLAEETGANARVVSLFAVLHDSQRENEGHDPQHGPRAAEFAAQLHGQLFELPAAEFALLYRACYDHTHALTHPEITVQTCFDADRLDLGRVNITPHVSRLCTDVAKRPAVLKWADDRAGSRTVPEFVQQSWGLEVDC
ncbi:hypothetical protein ETAA8_27420 [Anatilimnocola aggregata]|uniref:HD domain-containing protein n=1 Tax=Anatilimnocola aggregata TaxID=2528021 RepID=A0A517YBM1_9BACT|nr:hypothetical protein [Anatilimnocola aggregata]QDU27653.1 hypothetical protein ETAA8_27420 [Anatilimnocola aggregata]